MTIDKAIKILTDEVASGVEGTMFDLHNAQKLGIEALNRCKSYKEAHVGLHYEPMQGETEE